MSHAEPARDPLDALLAQRQWVRALARRLVADGDRADEIEQRTWLAAMERPPARLDSPRGWLAVALRNAARKHGGNAVIERCPQNVKQELDVFPDPGDSLAVMRSVKQRFDPGGELTPVAWAQAFAVMA